MYAHIFSFGNHPEGYLESLHQTYQAIFLYHASINQTRCPHHSICFKLFCKSILCGAEHFSTGWESALKTDRAFSGILRDCKQSSRAVTESQGAVCVCIMSSINQDHSANHILSNQSCQGGPKVPHLYLCTSIAQHYPV